MNERTNECVWCECFSPTYVNVRLALSCVAHKGDDGASASEEVWARAEGRPVCINVGGDKGSVCVASVCACFGEACVAEVGQLCAAHDGLDGIVEFSVGLQLLDPARVVFADGLYAD